MRPSADARFSSNYFHSTWHVLSDWHGAKIFAHLLWGLSYQRRPGTIVLIDRPNLDPNPFDAAPAMPIVLLQSPLTALSPKAAKQLRNLSGRSEGTVRVRTHGLTKELAAQQEWAAMPRSARVTTYDPSWGARQKVSNIGGTIVFAGGTLALRRWAVSSAQLGEHWYHGMDYAEIAYPQGEVQIFRQYRREVSIATQARAEVLAGPPPSNPDDLDRRIWDHAETVRRRRLPSKDKPFDGYQELASLIKGKHLNFHVFARDARVRCPRCDGCARMHSPEDHTDFGVPRVWRVTCPECTYFAERTATYVRAQLGPVDPIFGLPVWFQEKLKDGAVEWAFNRKHLAVLKALRSQTR